MLATTKVAGTVVNEACAADKSVQLIPSPEPCSLKVLAAAVDNGHVLQSNVMELMAVYTGASNSIIDFPTQF